MKKVIEFALSILSMVVKGFVFMYMWRWFVVPTFQLPTLSLPNAVGLCEIFDLLAMGLTVSIIWPETMKTMKEESPTVDWDEWSLFSRMVITVFVLYPSSLGIAYVVSRFL